MMKEFKDKCLEAATTVLPVTGIVLLLSLTPLYTLSWKEVIVFVVCALVLILGIALFSLGSQMTMEPMGEQLGSSFVKSKKLPLILAICFVVGFILTVAEPDVSELGELAEPVNGTFTSYLSILIGIGAAIFLVLGILKIIFKLEFSQILFFSYFLIFALVGIIIEIGNKNALGLVFDAGGVSTGAISAPFIMALGLGVAGTVGGRDFRNHSFGLVALCSIGPILIVLIASLFMKSDDFFVNPGEISLEIGESATDVLKSAFTSLLKVSLEVLAFAVLVLVLFLVIDRRYLHLPKTRKKQLLLGLLFTYLGSVLFLTASSVGFHPVGYEIGRQLAELSPVWLVLISFSIGIFVALAEPPVHVLAHSVEEVTNGGVSKKSMLIAVCIGVGVAIGLCMIRILYDFSILYYLVPGYLISLGLSLFVPKLHTAIAFDAGGVASGPVTLSLIMPLAIGACSVINSNAIMQNAFGIVAMVALAPLISIQFLGFKDILKKKTTLRNRIRQITDSEDERIIRF